MADHIAYVDNNPAAGNLVSASSFNDYNNRTYRGINPVYATTTGSANAQVLTLTGAASDFTTLTAGATFIFKAGYTNSAAMTLQVVTSVSNAAASVVFPGGSALSANSIMVNYSYAVIWNGTAFELQGVVLPSGATTDILVGGGAGVAPVWTTATGTGAPVRKESPSLTGTLTNTQTAANTASFASVAGAATQTKHFEGTGSTTAAGYGAITNTTGSILWGVESSAGTALITGAAAYRGVLRGGSGLTFSGDGGTTAHIDLASGGSVGIGNTVAATIEANNGFGRLVVGTGVGTNGMTFYGGTTAAVGMSFADATSGAGVAAGVIFYSHLADSFTLYSRQIATTQILAVGNYGPTYFYEGDASGYSTNDACMKTHKVAATGRSINAAGTINASGADYAEYERKAKGCGVVAKGQIIGFDAEGKVTDKWADAVNFGVKSTDPSYVGGDSWGADTAVLPDGSVLGKEPMLPLELPETEESAAVILAHEEAVKEFKARLETARAEVDRIAYSGKVPVNVLNAKVGDYIIPVQDDEGIVGKSIASPTFDQYRIAVGQVRRILPDGRAEISVKVS